MPRLAPAFARSAALALAALALVLPAPVAGAATQPAPDGLAFYTPPAPLPAGTHGDLIWSRTVKSTLPSAARTSLVLHLSTAVDGTPIAVSGTVAIPRGKAPKGGWPVISWGHGSTGIADACAPSRDSNDNPAHAYIAYVTGELDGWLKRGYAVARTDFEGLGTPGTHPYLIGRSEGRGIIDIVRAARQLDRRIGTRWISAGHSQGGHAALFAGGDARMWAPELKLRGVAAFAPASQLGTQGRLLPRFTGASPISGLVALIVEGTATVSDAVQPDALLSDAALALRPQVETTCLPQLSARGSFGGLSPASMVRTGADLNPVFAVLDAQNPALRIDAPVLLVQGTTDSTVLKFFTDQLKDQLKAKRVRVEYLTLAGVSHAAIVQKSAKQTNRWLRSRLG